MAHTNREMSSGPPPLDDLQQSRYYYATLTISPDSEDKMQTVKIKEGPAYVLQWTDREVSRDYLNSAGELRYKLQTATGAERQLFVMHGLPVDYLEVLGDMLDIDHYFIEAHIRRRNYRPLINPRRDRAASFAHFDYPELVQTTGVQAEELDGTSHSDDVVTDPPRYMLSDAVESAEFCRASLWLGQKATVLFLDRPSWDISSSGLCKAQYCTGLSTTVPEEMDISRTAAVRETPNLETLLHDNLVQNCAGPGVIAQLLEDIAVRQWLEFFEATSASIPADSGEATALLYLQTQNCLERNLAASNFRNRSRGPGVSTSEWETLLTRASRRAQLLSHLIPPIASIQIPPPVPQPKIKTSRKPANPDADSSTDDKKSDSENTRSLDRVSYMGGVLLPLSIVSGILSMGDDYGPGGPEFWIFWAVAVPLTLVTLLVIYADSIRKAEVWIIEDATGSGPGSEVENEIVNEKPSTPRLEAAMPMSYSATVPPVSNRFATYSLRPEDTHGDEDKDEDGGGEQATVVQKMWPAAKDGRWCKKELGWMGACATVFRVYKLKKGVLPPGARRSRTA